METPEAAPSGRANQPPSFQAGMGTKIFIAMGFLVIPMVVMNVAGSGGFDPTLRAIEDGDEVVNPGPRIPPICFVRDDGLGDACWTCHTKTPAAGAFSAFESMPWSTLEEDQRPTLSQISDREIDYWINTRNLAELFPSLEGVEEWQGRLPRIDPSVGIDADGFLLDRTGWRAVRQVPFPWMSWPLLGRHGEVYMRIARPFHRDTGGVPSRPVALLNHALIRAAVRSAGSEEIDVAVSPVDERLIAFDLDGDGTVSDGVEHIRRLPAHYAGAASDVALQRGQHPVGTEWFQIMRYLDPTQPGMFSVRVRELRYAVREEVVVQDEAARKAALEERGPVPDGSMMEGHTTIDGWRWLGFLENNRGRLRLQTIEESHSCSGCHEGLRTTTDGIFTTHRQLPGAQGWGLQDLKGMPDLTLDGMEQGELRTWLQRAGTGDPFGEAAGLLEAAVRAARDPGEVPWENDLGSLLYPDATRAYELNRALRQAASLQDGIRGGRWSRPSPIEVLANPAEAAASMPGPRHDDFRLPLKTR